MDGIVATCLWLITYFKRRLWLVHGGNLDMIRQNKAEMT